MRLSHAFTMVMLFSFGAQMGAEARGKRRYVEPEPSPSVIVEDPVPSSTPTAVPSVPAPEPSSSPVPVSTGKVSFSALNATKAEQAQLKASGELLNKVVQSKAFKDFLTKRQMVQTEGRTSKQVAEHLQSLSGNVTVEFYYECYKYKWYQVWCTTAVAERVGDMIRLNRAVWYPEQSKCEWASVLGHEALGHLLGDYGHDFNATARRPYSVPYSINEAVEASCTN